MPDTPDRHAWKCGDTFILPRRTFETEHLWVVLTEPDERDISVCVNVTTQRGLSCDTTVVLRPEDNPHPFVNSTSVVFYSDAQELDLSLVEDAINSNVRRSGFHKPCSDQLLRTLQDGLLASPHTPKGIKEKCSRLWSRPIPARKIRPLSDPTQTPLRPPITPR